MAGVPVLALLVCLAAPPGPEEAARVQFHEQRADPTTMSTSTTADDLSTTGAEESMTCRDGFHCLIKCRLQVPEPTPPDYPLDECLTSCLEELSNAELLKLHDLQECAETKCEATAEWECLDGTDDCLECFLQTLGVTMLPAGDECEAQSKACD